MARAIDSAWWLLPWCLLAMGCGPDLAPRERIARQNSGTDVTGPTQDGQGGASGAMGTSNGHTGSGRVAGAAGAGVTLSLSGPATALALTDSGGNFRFEGLADGAYTVTPQKDGYRFQPFSTGFVIAGQNAAEANFLSLPDPIAHGIFGSIDHGAGLDVILTLTGPLDVVQTAEADGSFGFTGLPDGRYLLTPSRPGVTFDPDSVDVIVNGEDVNGLKLTAKTN